MQGLQYRSAAGSGIAAAACKRPMAGVDLAAAKSSGVESPTERIKRMTSENAVLVFSMTQCCMCHVVKRLLCGLGVNPTVCELDEEPDGAEMEKILGRLVGQKPPLPAVFIGGNLVGGLDRLMAMHIAGDLVPKLKQAGALWL